MCKLHGVRLIKGIEIFESMLENQNLPQFLTKQLGLTFQYQLNWCRIIIQIVNVFLFGGKILGPKMQVKFLTFCKVIFIK